MKKTLMALVVILIVGAVAYAQNIGMMSGQRSRYCRSREQYMGLSMMGGGMMGSGMMSMVRHRYFMMYGIPLQYRNLRNPVQATEENIKEGGRLYSAQCALCHGSRGYGDGPGGKNLYPLPANISLAVRMPIATDSYLFWTISDGGKVLQTAMPAFKEVLSPFQIWKVILYLRAGLPAI
jgi:mono/diheme cytochrome c family protein